LSCMFFVRFMSIRKHDNGRCRSVPVSLPVSSSVCGTSIRRMPSNERRLESGTGKASFDDFHRPLRDVGPETASSDRLYLNRFDDRRRIGLRW